MENKESQKTEEENRGIQHLSHEHRLTLDEEYKEAEGVRCYGCLQLISSGPVYTCTPCQFVLHKFCAELPEKMVHPFHIEHQLSLLPRAGPSNDYICDICRQERPTGFSYNCDLCEFFVDINCASMMIKTQQPMEMEHGNHKHKLIPLEKSSNLLCDVCARKHEGSSYVCIECGFLVNQECAFLPSTIRHPYHQNHDLTLIHSVANEYYKSWSCCQICSERVFRNQWVYFCSDCKYFVHIKCSPASRAFKIAVMEKKESREIEHLSHRHRLTLDEDNKAGGVRCEGCLEPISSGPVYTCAQCPFFLHKFCAELPKKITHPLHIEHQLSLLPRIGRYRNYYRCDICGKVRPTEFSYHCEPCGLFVDIKCASIMIKIQETMEMEHGSHKHKLIPLEKSVNLTCNVCARKHEGSSYLCTECGFLVNQECAFLPTTLRHPYHREHDLTLIHSIPHEYFKSSICCQVCSEEIFRNQWVYFCSECRYFVHIKCSPASRDDQAAIKSHSNLAWFPWANEHPEEFGNLVARLINNVVGSQEKKTTDDDELRDISHIHEHEPLIFSLGNLQSKINGRCNVCKQIISTSFYKCAEPECKFIVHQWCAKLPKELGHSSHPEHLLRLLTQESLDYDPPRCQCCGFFNTTFYFGCHECRFYLDVKCAGAPSGIYHRSHDHPLTLRLFGSCSICGSLSGYYAFVCAACSHNVCIPCAFLPGKVNHRYDKHPFALTYSSPFNVKDNDQLEDEFKKKEYYYCEICEADINPQSWFYHCTECDQSLHIKCICPSIDLMYSKINL